jgi:citrate synthase
LPTTISAIDDGRLYYRGRDAVELSQELTLEEIAGLLWQTTPIVLPEISPEKGGVPPVAKALSALAGRVASDLPALGRRPAVLRSEAGAIMATVAAALAPGAQALQPLHERLAHGWKRPDASEPIRKALVLTAEHELNVSAFAARVTASSGAALSAAVLSGLATLTGPRHGGAWRDVTMLAAQARMHGVREAINAGLSSEGLLRAFGHRLYPHGDPRAKALMASFEAPSLYRDLAEAGEELLGEPVNIDFALAGLAVAFDLPSDAPLVMFALARTAGWLAHAMEQVESGELIRPRARYTEAEQQVS